MQDRNGAEFHNVEELVETVGWNVRNALLGEVYATPKPGLVDRRDTGSHSDMSYETFLASTEAITPYLSEMFEAGLRSKSRKCGISTDSAQDGADEENSVSGQTLDFGSDDLSGCKLTDDEKVFLSIRKIGMEAEKAMYAATGDVNTHKGMIFTMGILLAAAGIIAGEKLGQLCDDHEESSYGSFKNEKSGESEKETEIKTETESEIKTEIKPVSESEIKTETESGIVTEIKPKPESEIKTEPEFRAKSGLFDINEILETGRSMSCRILEKDFLEMAKREPRSHGEKLFHKYGEKGIRGQAMDGFPILKEIGLPAMRKYLGIAGDEELQSEIAGRATLRKDLLEDEGNMRDEHFENAVNISTLIAIMSELNDTNVLTRSSYEDMEWLKAESAGIVKIGAAFSEEGLSAIEELNVKCIEKNISPGGAADILAVTILLLKLEGISYV